MFSSALAVILIVAAQASSATAAPKGEPTAFPVHRVDIPVSFSSAVCSNQVSSLPLTAWKLGVFDAQLDGRYITRVGDLPISTDSLEEKAKSLADTRSSGGYAFGLCKDAKRGWVMALPAPSPVVRESETSLLLPRSELLARCSSFRADFAANEGGLPRILPTHRGHLSLVSLPSGVISLTCQPKVPRWQGPVLWYLYPVGTMPSFDPPAVDQLGMTTDAKRLLSWINRVRELERLPPLAPNPALDATATNLAADDSLTHNRTLVQSASKDLRERRIDLLGEDRVKGADVQTMAWLLWHSPRHRESLLNSQASVVGIGTRSSGDEQLVVLVTGAASSASTARRLKTTGPGFF